MYYYFASGFRSGLAASGPAYIHRRGLSGWLGGSEMAAFGCPSNTMHCHDADMGGWGVHGDYYLPHFMLEKGKCCAFFTNSFRRQEHTGE